MHKNININWTVRVHHSVSTSFTEFVCIIASVTVLFMQKIHVLRIAYQCSKLYSFTTYVLYISYNK